MGLYDLVTKKPPLTARPLPIAPPADPKAPGGIVGPIIGNGITGIRGAAATQGAQAGANAAAMGSFAGGGTPGVPGQPMSPGSIASQAGSFTGRGLPGGPIGGNYASQAGTAMGQFGAAPGVVNNPAAPMSNNIQRTAGPIAPAGTTGRAGAVGAGAQYMSAPPPRTGYVPPPEQMVTNAPPPGMGSTVMPGQEGYIPDVAPRYRTTTDDPNSRAGGTTDPNDPNRIPYAVNPQNMSPEEIASMRARASSASGGGFDPFTAGGLGGTHSPGHEGEVFGNPSSDYTIDPVTGAQVHPGTSGYSKEWVDQNGFKHMPDGSVVGKNPDGSLYQASGSTNKGAMQAGGAAVGAPLGPPITDAGRGGIDSAMAALVGRSNLTAPGPAAKIGATQGPGAVRIANTAGPTAAQVAPTAAPVAARVGAVERAGSQSIAPVSLAAPAPIEAYLAERSKVNERQMTLADQLQAAAAGGVESPGALAVRREMEDQEAAQLSLAASASPAGRAAALRGAMQNAGRIRGGAASEINSRNAAYQESARNSLMGLLGTARGQDITEGQGEMNAVNTARGLTGQLGTQTAIAGAQIAGQQSIAQADVNARTSIANAEAANAAAMQNAGFQQQSGMFGAQTAANAALQNAGFQQQTGLAQYTTDAAARAQEAGFAQQTGLAQYQTEAARAQRQAELDTQAGQFGAQFGLAQQGQNDTSLLGLINAKTGAANVEQQGQLAQQAATDRITLANMDDATRRQLAALAAEQARKGDPSMMDRLIVGGLTVAGAVVGGIYGGPGGAAAGGTIGGATGRAIT